MPMKKRNDKPLLDKYLAANELARIDIIGDGSCLFRSVAQLVYGSQDDHLVLRLKCAKFIYHHREDFEPFLDVPFDEYVQSICCPHNLAGNFELEALSRLLDVEITVISTGTVPITFGEGRSRKVKLAYANGNHYDAVVPKEEAETLQQILKSLAANKEKTDDFMNTIAAQHAFAYFADDDQVIGWLLKGIETEELMKRAAAEKDKERISLGFNFAEDEKGQKVNVQKKAVCHTLAKNFIDPLDMQRIENNKIIAIEEKEKQERLERLEKERLEKERLEKERLENEQKENEIKKEDNSANTSNLQNGQNKENGEDDSSPSITVPKEASSDENTTNTQEITDKKVQSSSQPNAVPRKKGNPKKRYRQEHANDLYSQR